MNCMKKNMAKGKTESISYICEEDQQEICFDEMVNLWVNGKIEYKQLMRNFPDYDFSMAGKIFRQLTELVR